jgi:hypothetical protein
LLRSELARGAGRLGASRDATIADGIEAGDPVKAAIALASGWGGIEKL